MRKMINTLMAGLILGGLSVGMTGCSEETGTTEKTKITTPTGTTTQTDSSKINKSGDNPPLAPAEKK